MIHQLKIEKRFYERIISGEKTFEIRKNDRDFQKGDELYLVLSKDETDNWQMQSISVKVTYILHGPLHGLAEGYCIMGITKNL